MFRAGKRNETKQGEKKNQINRLNTCSCRKQLLAQISRLFLCNAILGARSTVGFFYGFILAELLTFPPPEGQTWPSFEGGRKTPGENSKSSGKYLPRVQ